MSHGGLSVAAGHDDYVITRLRSKILLNIRHRRAMVGEKDAFLYCQFPSQKMAGHCGKGDAGLGRSFGLIQQGCLLC